MNGGKEVSATRAHLAAFHRFRRCASYIRLVFGKSLAAYKLHALSQQTLRDSLAVWTTSIHEERCIDAVLPRYNYP